jgi:hypothetical protein
MGLLGAALAVAPGLADAQILDLVYERSVMTAADGRCGLFAPEVSAALAAAQAQARGAALRAGQTPEIVESVERRARARSMSTNCASPDLAVAANRVRSAYAGYARLSRISFPGDQGSWRADRTGPGHNRWRLVQGDLAPTA